jgi:hypothetical protein
MPTPNLTLPYLIEAVRLHGNSDECLPWPFTCDEDGYGRCTYEGVTSRVPRVAYILFIGAIPEGQLIRHFKCDNPPCFNPRHLLPGSIADNDRDRDNKGRASGPKGAANINSKLTVELVRQLRNDRAAGMTWEALAAKYGLQRHAAWCAGTRKTWKYVK